MNRFGTVMVVSGLIAGCLGSGMLSASETWPGFRGWGDSHSRAENLPLTWQPRGRAAGNWTMRLPGYGQSSPVVWHDRIFVTAVSGEEKEHLHLLAVNLEDGEILWRRDFDGTQRVKDSDTVSRGAPTPVVDEHHVYAVFESGDVHAVTHEGESVWNRSFVADHGEIQGPHGYASSPVLVDDLLMIQVAHSGPSYILALEKQTGKNRWKVDHPSQTGWSSPSVIQSGDDKAIIVSTSGSVRALRAESGEELWRVDEVEGNTIASPTIVGDLVVIGVGSERGGGGGDRGARSDNARPNNTARPAESTRRGDSVENAPPSDDEPAQPAPAPNSSNAVGASRASLAIRLGDMEHADGSRVAWRSPRVSVGYASPVVIDGHAYFVNRVGVLQCVDLTTGEFLWQHRLPGPVWATPIAHQGYLVIFCKDGQVITMAAGRYPVEVAESQLSATDIVYGVAAVEGSWIVRSGRGLTRISSPSTDSATQSPE